jgi:predicted ATPase
MPAKAGIQFPRYRIFWIPAFAGMTVCISDNSPVKQIDYKQTDHYRIYKDFMGDPGKYVTN